MRSNALLLEREKPVGDSYTDEFYRPVARPAAVAWEQETVRRFQVSLAGHLLEMTVPASGIPAWLPAAISGLQALRALRINWDSYGALPVDSGAILGALDVLVRAMPRTKATLPSFLATNDGGVTLAWHDDSKELDVTVHQGNRASFYFSDPSTGVEIDDQPLILRGSELTEYIAKFA